MTAKSATTLLALAAAVGAGCGDHDPELDRVGGPIPDGGFEADSGSDSASDAARPVAWCATGSGEPSAYAVMSVCRRCHQDPPRFGAPFSLLTWDDTQVKSSVGSARFDAMYLLVENGSMPFRFSEIDPPVAPLSAEDKTTLLTWIEQGAQAVGGRGCEGK